jgi:SAM-dependent methyltransferase
MSDQISRYYENYDEDGRLVRDKAHLTEYLTTIRYFDRLFEPNSRILDACAGTGRYAFYLADKGHIVTACDLAEHNVKLIKANTNAEKLEDAAVCNALDLSRFGDNSFDAVLCMGAMYHLRTNELRYRAVSECVRVCKPGGVIALAYITKNGAVLANINADAGNMDALVKILDDTDEGIFFCTAPCEIEDMAVSCGLEKLYNITTDGPIYAVGSKLNNASEENFQKYMLYHYRVCEDPGMLGAGLHGLWIGRKS